MNTVVADACPVIFLAKLNRLTLIDAIFPGTIILPEGVRKELACASIPPDERRHIDEFLKHCRVETVQGQRFSASALSAADRQVLSLADRHPRSILVTDDSLMRRIARARGQAVAGTLGLIVRAERAGLMTKQEALGCVDELVTKHRLRIVVDLYQETLRQIRDASP